MYQNLINQNPMINQFNGYSTQNPNFIPFQTNQLINQNVHVLNGLNDLVQQHKMIQQNMGMYQQQIQQQPQINQQSHQTNKQKRDERDQAPSRGNRSNNSNAKPRGLNIIEEMLKPQKIKKENKDVAGNYKNREAKQKEKFQITNAPYKNIIKDKIVTKKVQDVKEEDLLVHKSIHEIDADKNKFERELKIKKKDTDKINDELKIEFDIDNYDKHKKKFEYKETFIRNLAYEENTFDESKQDFVEFYKQKQKEAKDGMEICDQILRGIVDNNIISKDELPLDSPTDHSTTDIDINAVIKNVQIDDGTTNIKTTEDTAPKINPMANRKKKQTNAIASVKKEELESEIPKTQNKKLPIVSKTVSKNINPVKKDTINTNKTVIDSVPLKRAPISTNKTEVDSVPLKKNIVSTSKVVPDSMPLKPISNPVPPLPLKKEPNQNIPIKSELIKSTITKPITSTVTKPITPTATKPITPTATKSITSTVTKPITSTATKPITSTVTKPITPTATKPITSTVTKPITSTATKPITSTVTSTVTKPITPTVTKPTSTLAKLKPHLTANQTSTQIKSESKPSALKQAMSGTKTTPNISTIKTAPNRGNNMGSMVNSREIIHV
jgi:hypothetical protein